MLLCRPGATLDGARWPALAPRTRPLVPPATNTPTPPLQVSGIIAGMLAMGAACDIIGRKWGSR